MTFSYYIYICIYIYVYIYIYIYIYIHELVGLYLLNRLGTVVDKSSVGLYRDDGIAVINNANGPKLDRIRKDIITLFKEEGLPITIETNLIETDFLDVTFNLEIKKYFSF